MALDRTDILFNSHILNIKLYSELKRNTLMANHFEGQAEEIDETFRIFLVIHFVFTERDKFFAI